MFAHVGSRDAPLYRHTSLVYNARQ